MDNADNIVPSEAITGILEMTDSLEFVENLNTGFHLYKSSVTEGQELTSKGLITYVREVSKWSKKDLDYLQNLSDELD